MKPHHIAVVDDEPDITLLLANYLKGHGFRVSRAGGGAALMDLMRQDVPQLVLLDIGLGSEDGLVLARHLREHWRVAIILVTGRSDPVDKIVGLEMGADDYVTKPFDLRELLARIKAVLRRTLDSAPALDTAPASQSDQLGFFGWVLDCSGRRLLAPGGQEVDLTTGEFDLLRVFASHPGRVLSRDFLLDATRGREAAPFDRAIDVLVSRLRKKIEPAPSRPEMLKSVRNVGYVLVHSAPASAIDERP